MQTDELFKNYLILYIPHAHFMLLCEAFQVVMESQRKPCHTGQISPNNDSQPLQTHCLHILPNTLLVYQSYYLKSRLLRPYNFKRFECCEPKNRRRKHSLDIKGNIKGHMWFVSMGAVIENLINLNISTSYFLVTHIVVLLSL